MGQTTVVFPGLKKLYRASTKNAAVDRFVHGVLNAITDAIARVQGFAFPKKFNWDWKLEMILHLYEKETVALCRRMIRPGMKVIDIGAHIGYFTRIYSKLVGPTGHVYAFEADPENARLLEHNLRRYVNVKLFAEAIADRTGTIDFFETENNTGCHSLIASDKRPNKLSVSCITLDELRNNGTIPHVDVIKMDIEGGEPLALVGMRETIAANPDLVLITEFCPDNLTDTPTSPVEYLSQIHELGLRTYAVTANGLQEITPDLNRVGTYFIKPGYHYVNILAAKQLPALIA